VEEESEESEPSKVFSAVRFGWNSVFSVNSSANQQLSEADIERIIDRTRGNISSSGKDGEKAPADTSNDSKEEGAMEVVGNKGKMFVAYSYLR
jgi:hypothetical protein